MVPHVYEQRTADLAASPPATEAVAPLIDLLVKADRLAAEIERLAATWDATDEVDTNLGIDVASTGRDVMSLLDTLTATTRPTDRVRTRQLRRHAIELHEAIEFYDELEEHQTDASIDIFDRLMPGLALAQRVLDVIDDPAAARRVTVGELIEHLQQFPHHLQVWFADHSSPEGYVPLDGTVGLGHDQDSAPGEPPSFVVVGRDELPSTGGEAPNAVGTTSSRPLALDDDLRGSMLDGYDDDRVNFVLGRISDLSGLRLVCVWDFHDAFGFGGHSQFYVEADRTLRELIGDLWLWLNGSTDEPATPASPDAPDRWVGPPTEIRSHDLPYSDGLHNYAVRDLST